MRADLHEVLIERPRSGQRRKTARGNKPRAADWVDEDSYADSYDPGRHRTKWFDDLLSPLKRWLRSQVNRPWDKAWSELASGIDARSMSGRHLLDHVRDLVTIDGEYDEGRRAVVRKPHLGRSWRDGSELVYRLYVDPRTGILRWREPPSRRALHRSTPEPLLNAAGQPVQVHQLSPSRRCLKCNGIWYEVQIVEAAARARNTSNILSRGAARFQITHKRQLSSRELADAKLNNDA